MTTWDQLAQFSMSKTAVPIYLLAKNGDNNGCRKILLLEIIRLYLKNIAIFFVSLAINSDWERKYTRYVIAWNDFLPA